MNCVINIKRVGILGLTAFALFYSSLSFAEIERPSIWVTNAERADILDKIETKPWAKSLFNELKHRVKKQAFEGKTQRRKHLEQLPLLWPKDKTRPPILPTFRHKDGGTRKQLSQVVKSLQDGVDCGVLYYLTQEKKYATCAADILNTFVNALTQLKVNSKGPMNAGWMFPTDHLYEARVIGAQLPIIYDFVQPYLKSGGQVYDLATKKLVSFNFKRAQNIFKTYVWLALNKGLLDSNWPVLESSSLVHNILANDNKADIQKNLQFYTHVDTKRQASLKTVAKHFENTGDIWPESLGYSRHVAAFSIYLMTLLDRYDSELKLGQKYPNIPAAFTAYYNLQYPNNEFPFFGDGHRQSQIEYPTLEMSLQLAQLNGNKEQINNYSSYLASSIKAGVYDRSHLHKRSYGANPYFTPLQLLWSLKNIDGSTDVDVAPDRPRTNRLEFAGMNIQRNISKTDPIKNSLMGFVAGGSYIHGHATGMDMELYGQGHVLGIDGGKGKYRSDIHENYYRLFAAHNSVISNGASASKGDWINLGINKVQALSTEPVVGDAGVSPNHSFSTSSFYDEFNLVAPAHHQRTLALIKVSENQGYYLDVFRAKSDTQAQFHDYVYHNIGDELVITSNNKAVNLKADDGRYQASSKLPWISKGQRGYKHPGWHFFEQVKTKNSSTQQYEATFNARKLADKNIAMRAIIPEGLRIDITQVKAPKAYGAAKPYNKKPLPTFLLRHQGETWLNPFAVVFESITEGKNKEPSYAVQSVERIMFNGIFKGVKVKLNVEGKQLTQYVLVQENIDDIYQDESSGIRFQGEFAVITVDEKDNATEMYLGKGVNLQYNQQKLIPSKPSTSGYIKF